MTTEATTPSPAWELTEFSVVCRDLPAHKDLLTSGRFPRTSAIMLRLDSDQSVLPLTHPAIQQAQEQARAGLERARQEFAKSAASSKWQRLQADLAAARQKAQEAQAKIADARGRAQQALEAGRDPDPHEEACRSARHEQEILDDRVVTLARLESEAKAAADGQLRQALEKRRQELKAAAEQRWQRLAGQLAEAIAGRLAEAEAARATVWFLNPDPHALRTGAVKDPVAELAVLPE